MTQVGETLRRERLRRNLDLDQVSRELKISARFLEAIEHDQYEKLPGGVFAKSFVRQYARMLGLDEDEIAGQLQSVIAPPPDLTLLAEKPHPVSVAPISVPRVDEWETVGDRGFRWSGSLSAAAMVVVVMLICSAVYAWLQRPKSNPVTATSAPVQSAAPPQAQPAPQASLPPTVTADTAAASNAIPGQPPVESKSPETPATANPSAESRPVETKTSDAAKPPVVQAAASNPDATVHVRITADEAAWVMARADGKYAFSATMNAGDTRSVEGVKDVLLRLGNAGGVSISLNGKSVGAVGPKGQTRTVQLTSGGFQIVAAKPAAPPIDPIDHF